MAPWLLRSIDGRHCVSAVVLLILLGANTSALTAPLPPLPPVDVCGDIHYSRWLPPRSLPPVAGLSGSAAHRRDWPGRFVVVLDNVHGPSDEQKARINALLETSSDGVGVPLEPRQMLLVVAADDASRFSGTMAICVTGFLVTGDEGGTWTRYTELDTFPDDGRPREK